MNAINDYSLKGLIFIAPKINFFSIMKGIFIEFLMKQLFYYTKIYQQNKKASQKNVKLRILTRIIQE